MIQYILNFFKSLYFHKRNNDILVNYDDFHYINYMHLIRSKLKHDRKYICNKYNKGSIVKERHLEKVDELLLLIKIIISCYEKKDFYNYKKQSREFFIKFSTYHTILY